MYDFSEINKIADVVSNIEKNHDETAQALFIEALKNIKKFNSETNYNKLYLKKAVEKLLEVVKITHHNAEAFTILAYCMYILGQDEFTLQYLKAAISINPDLPLIHKLQDLITNNYKVENIIPKKAVSDSIKDDSNLSKKISSVSRLSLKK